jgi:hypothetical protein
MKDGDGEIDQMPEALAREVADLARRARQSDGPVIRTLLGFGGKAETWFNGLPAPARAALDGFGRTLLLRLYHGAGVARAPLPDAGRWGHRIAASLSGAAGGSAGLATAMIELPATVMLMFAAMQKVAEEEGFDPQSEEVRLACLDIFGAGRPGPKDDGINTAFLGVRLSLNATTVQALISQVLPAFSAMLGRQLASKAVPVIGAVAGAGINYAFTDYYQEVARVRFGLMRLVREHGRDRIHHAFRAEMARVMAG